MNSFLLHRLGHLKLRLLIMAASTAAGPLFAADWPQWRGPDRTGIASETGLLKEWPTNGPPLVWKAIGLGAGYSSVAVVGSRIFTLGDGADAAEVIALSTDDGSLLWRKPLGRPGGGGGYPGPRCTPTVDGDRVYALGQHGDLVCLRVADGREVWRKNLKSDFEGRVGGWGYSESPLVDGDAVICTPGSPKGTLLALNKRTGETLWRSRELTDSADYTSVIVAEIDGVRQYIPLTQASVAGVAAKDGRLLWRAERKGATAVIPTPIYHDHHVFVTSGYGVGCNLFKVSSTNGHFTVEQAYANRDMVNHHGGVVRIGDHLYGYCDRNGWSCLDFKTGRVLWSSKKLGKGAVVAADGHLILRSEGSAGTVALIEATPEGYREKGRFAQPDRSGKNSWPHPVVSGGRLYLRDQDVLLCFNLKA
ncbi:MAG TPA: PQQ-binding-like beta-propeller repeat protein [Methylomirabilota bacterium]|nr:PQQ-binding-like beta-propeller repeat protein [Methylomirabilota bacterium]